jgi:DNA-binding CsgD family transcriptional regulator
METLEMRAEGLSNKQIAARLRISVMRGLRSVLLKV